MVDSKCCYKRMGQRFIFLYYRSSLLTDAVRRHFLWSCLTDAVRRRASVVARTHCKVRSVVARTHCKIRSVVAGSHFKGHLFQEKKICQRERLPLLARVILEAHLGASGSLADTRLSLE